MMGGHNELFSAWCYRVKEYAVKKIIDLGLTG
jgi:hypothetical protein